jgi:hypothetical protein
MLRPIKISISGRFWDSWIYRDCLYVFGLDGSVSRYQWTSLVSALFETAYNPRLATTIAVNAGTLYSDGAKLFISDQQHNALLQKQITECTETSYEVSRDLLNMHQIQTYDTGMPTLHTDSSIYNGNVYTASPEGVFHAPISESSKKLFKTSGSKVTDTPGIKMSIKYGAIALAAGSEGLFEINVDNELERDSIQLSDSFNTDCSWLFGSILGIGDDDGAMVYQMEGNSSKTKYKDIYTDEFEKKIGKFANPIDKVDVYKHLSIDGGFRKCFGLQDKIGVINHKGLQIANYNPWSKEKNTTGAYFDFTPQKETSISDILDIISAGIAYFGVIIEQANKTIVLGSNNHIYKLEGPSLRWRAFPGSQNYVNQLHRVTDNGLEIYLFVHDFFVDQSEKLFGSYYSGQKRFSSIFR